MIPRNQKNDYSGLKQNQQPKNLYGYMLKTIMLQVMQHMALLEIGQPIFILLNIRFMLIPTIVVKVQLQSYQKYSFKTQRPKIIEQLQRGQMLLMQEVLSYIKNLISLTLEQLKMQDINLKDGSIQHFISLIYINKKE